MPPEETDPTPRTVDWNNPRVAAILEAAAKCFSRKGFSATTLAEIGKELGLRKSIVHYYFASKAALIHEVQSYTYFKYLERVRDAVRSELNPGERSAKGIHALWEAAGDGNVGLNIEVWSASRNDEELKRRAAALQKEKRKLVAQSIADMLGADPSRIRESLCTLVLSVLNGLTVCEYVEGESAKAQEAFDIFVSLLRAGLQNLDTPQPHSAPSAQVPPPHLQSQPPQSQPPQSQQVPQSQPSHVHQAQSQQAPQSQPPQSQQAPQSQPPQSQQAPQSQTSHVHQAQAPQSHSQQAPQSQPNHVHQAQAPQSQTSHVHQAQAPQSQPLQAQQAPQPLQPTETQSQNAPQSQGHQPQGHLDQGPQSQPLHASQHSIHAAPSHSAQSQGPLSTPSYAQPQAPQGQPQSYQNQGIQGQTFPGNVGAQGQGGYPQAHAAPSQPQNHGGNHQSSGHPGMDNHAQAQHAQHSQPQQANAQQQVDQSQQATESTHGAQSHVQPQHPGLQNHQHHG